MCGRYTETRPAEEVAERFDCEPGRAVVEPRYNIAPGQSAPVVVRGRSRILRSMRWGLIPAGSESEAVGYKMINARSETAAEKRAFREAFHRRRCLVPADGFYEWKRASDRKTKTPYRFVLKSGGLFAFAGLWELWRDAEGEEVFSFTILTTEPNPRVAPVHNRMPVILPERKEAAWLSGDTGMEGLQALLRPYPEAYMDAYEVSTYVNAAHHEGRTCIEPVGAAASAADELPLFDAPDS